MRTSSTSTAVGDLFASLVAANPSWECSLTIDRICGMIARHDSAMLSSRMTELSYFEHHEVPLVAALMCAMWGSRDSGLSIENLHPSLSKQVNRLILEGIVKISDGDDRLCFTEHAEAVLNEGHDWQTHFQLCAQKILEIQTHPEKSGREISLVKLKTDGAVVGSSLRLFAFRTIVQGGSIKEESFPRHLLDLAPHKTRIGHTQRIANAFRSYLYGQYSGFDRLECSLREQGLIQDYRLPGGIGVGAMFSQEASDILMQGVEKLGKGYGQIILDSRRNPFTSGSTGLKEVIIDGRYGRPHSYIYIDKKYINERSRELFQRETGWIVEEWNKLAESNGRKN